MIIKKIKGYLWKNNNNIVKKIMIYSGRSNGGGKG
jgi:hypothetical protein